MKELENIISELVSINIRLANNFKTEEGKELRADLFDITQKLERYKQAQALQLQQTGVNGSFFKCTCLIPQTNCFSGKCSYCNKTIQKDITTDDL